MIILSFILISILLCGIYMTFCCIKLDKDEEIIVERWGSFHRKLCHGCHFIIPFIETFRSIEFPNKQKNFKAKITTSKQKMSFPKDNRIFYTKNNNQLKINTDVTFKITDTFKAVYEVEYLFDAINQMLAGIIQNRLLNCETGSTEDDIKKLKEIISQLITSGNRYSNLWGVEIVDIKLYQITDTQGIRYNINKQ